MKFSLDSLNNSQMILLVLLVTLVTSSAVSIAVLSVVYERVRGTGVYASNQQSTIIQQTIEKITQKVDPAPVASVAPVVTRESEVSTVEIAALARASLVPIYFGSQPTTVGVFVSPDGDIISAVQLSESRRYSIVYGDTAVPYVVVASDAAYSLLRPLEEGEVQSPAYIPILKPTITVGQPVIIFGGFGEDERLFEEVISQFKSGGGVPRLRTSVTSVDVVTPAAVFVKDVFIGFIPDSSGWLSLIDTRRLFSDDGSVYR